MEQTKKQPTTRPRFVAENIYALKLLWGISPWRVIHEGLYLVIDYGMWIFSSIIFLRYIIDGIEAGATIQTLLGFVVFAAVLVGGTQLYYALVFNAIRPMTDVSIMRSLHATLYRKAGNVELRCYEDADFYNKYTMALDNAGGRIPNTVSTFLGIVVGALASGVAFYLMYTIDPFAVLFIISPILGNFLFGALLSRLAAKRYAESTPHNRKIGYVKRVLYLAEFAKEVRMSNIYDLMMQRYSEGVKGVQDVADTYARKGTFFLTTKNILTFAFVFQGIMMYAAFRALVTGTLSLAELAVIFSAMVTTSWIFIGLFENVSASLQHVVFVGYLRGFLAYEEKIPSDQDGVMPAETIERIEFKNVSFAYDISGQAIIKNCSFVINQGDIVAFAGHNGAGKSTLIKLLLRLYDPTEGEVLLNGINIKAYNLAAYRKLFSTAFQDYQLFSLSVAENVLLNIDTPAHGDSPTDTARKALEQAGVYDIIAQLPKGMDTTLTKEFDENGAVLSGGNAQKVIVAKAFASSAPIKVYDEPTSALDPIAEYELYNTIMQHSRAQANHTTIFISHRLSSVADANKIFVFEQGELVETGNHAELMALGSTYAHMYTMQARSYLAEAEEVSQ